MNPKEIEQQIVRTAPPKLMSGADPERSNRVMKALMQMDKIDIKRPQQAYDEKQAKGRPFQAASHAGSPDFRNSVSP